jgi:hypothetical protein
MDQDEEAAPRELTPRSRKRKAVREAKAAAKRRDPVAFRALRAEQERNRLQNKKSREAAKAAFEAEGHVVSGTTPPSSSAAAAVNAPLSLISCSASGIATCPLPPPTGDATIHHTLPYGLTPPPPSPIPPPILPPSTLPFLPLAPPAPPAPPNINRIQQLAEVRVRGECEC